MKKRPQVLLLGNGINRGFGGIEWGQLLSSISVRHDVKQGDLVCPMPLQVMLLTNNSIKEAMRENKTLLFGSVSEEAHMRVLKQLLSFGFDDILTTNYSYELELASLGTEKASEGQIKKLSQHTDAVAHVDNKYLLHSFNCTDRLGASSRIWHIHGEARKPDSMIIGHYYYAFLLNRIIQYIDQNTYRYHRILSGDLELDVKSWIDSFILGDVYILGFGFDYSEFDLWWLLNRKARELTPHGQVYFFEPITDGFDEKVDLLKLLGVKCINCGIEKSKCDYVRFYQIALSSIEKIIRS